MCEPEVAGTFSQLLGFGVLSARPIGTGRNSQVFRLDCGPAGVFAGKRYYDAPHDDRCRMQREVLALQFLNDHGVVTVPSIVAINWKERCAVYEYLQGRELLDDRITQADVDGLVQFLCQLQTLRTADGAADLPLASDACLCVWDVLQGVRDRLARLQTCGQSDSDLQRFLDERFIPLLGQVVSRSQAQASEAAIDVEAALSREQCVLSPSDIGFHNILKKADGTLVFLDFEYFGWDDPAKMLCDCLLHPGVRMSRALKQRLLNGMLEVLAGRGQVAQRLKVTYALHGLKWCMILLNEFVPEEFQRRVFAGGDAVAPETIRSVQLEKAKRMCERIEREYESFPYEA